MYNYELKWKLEIKVVSKMIRYNWLLILYVFFGLKNGLIIVIIYVLFVLLLVF